MDYKLLAKECEALSYRDKFRLAQLLIQLARKEEENENPSQKNGFEPKFVKDNNEGGNSLQYIMDRIAKLRPKKKKTLMNAIKSMHQFQGGISEEGQERIIRELENYKFLIVEQNDKINYLNIDKKN
jgi:hypothetical protein